MLDFSHSRLKPFAHQIEDTQTLVDHPYLLIASEMRTGKTKIVIDGAQFMYVAGVIDRVIVVAPNPVRDVWFDFDLGELKKHLWKGIPARIIEYHARPRAWNWGEKQEDQLQWFVTNYEFIRSKPNLQVLLKYCSPTTLLVCDESSFIKTYNSKQTEACFELRERCGRVVLLNGTPIDHSPLDLFSQANILHPDILQCGYITHFKARYARMAPILGKNKKVLTNKWGRKLEQISEWVNLDDLRQRMAPYVVRRLQKDCLDLPPKLDPVPYTVPLDSPTWKAYKQMRDECVLFFEQATSVSMAQQAIVKTIRLSQITSGFVGGVQAMDIGGIDAPASMRDLSFDDWLDSTQSLEPIQSSQSEQQSGTDIETSGSGIREVGREKLDLLIWLLKNQLEADENLHIVVWCRFRPELFRMLREVEKQFPQFAVGGIFGGQKSKDRLRSMALLKPETSPKGPVFVAGTFGTGSYGLDFTAAHTSVNCSYDYRFGKFKQSGDRVYGPGQIYPVAYFDFIATGPNGQKTIDHQIIKARQEADDIANWTVSAWIKSLRDE
jgi:hypothetical protein